MTKGKAATWRGHKQYGCPTCAYTTLHEDKLTDHLAKAHPKPRMPSKAPEQLDPLGELSNEEYEQLTPAEKGARTRQANEAAEQLDPLGELSNEEYEQLTPAEKGARTRQANEAAEQELPNGDNEKGQE